MKILDPAKHTPQEIDAEGTRQFEAFLDRNYPGWRTRELHKAKRADTIQRDWLVGVEDMERVALYRGEYVEIQDRLFRTDPDDEQAAVTTHYANHRLCDINGDLTPIGAWGNRQE